MNIKNQSLKDHAVYLPEDLQVVKVLVDFSLLITFRMKRTKNRISFYTFDLSAGPCITLVCTFHCPLYRLVGNYLIIIIIDRRVKLILVLKFGDFYL